MHHRRSQFNTQSTDSASIRSHWYLLTSQPLAPTTKQHRSSRSCTCRTVCRKATAWCRAEHGAPRSTTVLRSPRLPVRLNPRRPLLKYFKAAATTDDDSLTTQLNIAQEFDGDPKKTPQAEQKVSGLLQHRRDASYSSSKLPTF